MCFKAGIYKADFLEERKDREEARGALEDMRKKRGGQDLVFHEEIAALHKEIDAVREERDHLKKIFAGTEAKYRDELTTSKRVIANFRQEMEEVSSEKDHWKQQFAKVEKISSDRDHWKQQYMICKETISALIKQLEKISSERVRWKQEADQKKMFRSLTEKEFKKMKHQVS